MKRLYTMICKKDYLNNGEALFTNKKTYQGMVRFMQDAETGEIKRAIRVKTDTGVRFFLYEVADQRFLDEHFILIVNE